MTISHYSFTRFQGYFQELILRTVDKIKQEDSQGVINVLGESRHMLSDIFEELKREQEECRRQFQEISKLQLRPETSQGNQKFSTLCSLNFQ